MQDYSYYMPVKIKWGREIILKEYRAFKPFGSNVAIISGKASAAKSGALSDIIAACGLNEQTYKVFNTVQNNPSVENVLELAKEIYQYKPDFLLAIGGGSVLDASKVIALLLRNGIKEETIWRRPKLKPMALIAVPTTAGTGSEVTPYAVLTDNKLQTKKSVSSELIYPDMAFLDPRYTESLPLNVTINTAIDALSHLIEGFFALRANSMSDMYALEGLKIIAEAIPSLLTGEFTAKDRNSFLAASLFGGLTIAKTGTTLVHALGYSLTFFHNIEHGRANGLLLSAYLDYLKKTAPQKTGVMIKTLNFSNLDEFQALLGRIFPEKLYLSTREIALYVEKALKTSNVSNTPGVISAFVLADILERSVN